MQHPELLKHVTAPACREGAKRRITESLQKGQWPAEGKRAALKAPMKLPLPTTAEALIGFLCLPKGSTTRERCGIVEEVQYTVTDT